MKNYSYHVYTDHIEAMGSRTSGRIIIDVEKYENSGAISTPDIIKSSIRKGLRKDSLAAHLFDEQGSKLLVDAVCVCYLQRQRSQIHSDEGKALHNYMVRNFIESTEYCESSDESDVEAIEKEIDRLIDNGIFEHTMGVFFSSGYSKHGWKGAEKLAAIIKKIETSIKGTTEEEEFFLDCVTQCTNESRDVPTQKTVFNKWYDPSLRISHDTFRGIRDRLGFSWLPQDIRGKEGATDEALGKESKRWCRGEPT